MKDLEQVSSLIGDIYDAAEDPTRWSAVLRGIRNYVGGSAAALFAKDAVRQDLDVCYEDGGFDPHYRQAYFDTYATPDPFATGRAVATVEEPVSTADLLPYDQFLESRFNKEWAAPQRLVDFVCAVLDKTTTGTAMIGVFRHERDGLVDAAARGRLRLLVPHIRRAVLIGRAIELKTAEAATLADTFNGVSAGLFLVDATGNIMHANASGHAMLKERAVLRSAAGKLVAIDAKATAALSEIFARADYSDAAAGIKGIAVPLRAGDDTCFLAHVLPLASDARRRRPGASCAAVFVHKAELEAPSPPETIARAYGLTPGELRVLLAIVQVGGVPETAEELGLSEATVKTHLHRLFAKTGGSRQADLVKVIAGFAHPLVGRPCKATAPMRRLSFDERAAPRLAAV